MKKFVLALIIFLLALTMFSFADAFENNIISKGAKGDEVKELQTRLHDLGYYSKSIDGDFGNGTEEALIHFQKHNGVRQDGKLDIEGRCYLFSDFAVAENQESIKPMNTVLDIFSGVYDMGEGTYWVIDGNTRSIYNIDFEKIKEDSKKRNRLLKPYYRDDNYYFTYFRNKYCMIDSEIKISEVTKNTKRNIFGIDENGIYIAANYTSVEFRDYKTDKYSQKELNEIVKSFMDDYNEFAESFTFVKPEEPQEPKIGMTKSQVEKSTWGKPQKKNISEYKWGTEEQWVYSKNRYVYFYNGIVTAIQKQE